MKRRLQISHQEVPDLICSHILASVVKLDMKFGKQNWTFRSDSPYESSTFSHRHNFRELRQARAKKSLVRQIWMMSTRNNMTELETEMRERNGESCLEKLKNTEGTVRRSCVLRGL